jgi:hypothetical protein
MKGTVYGIKDKRDGRIVYVGCTTQKLYTRWGQQLQVLTNSTQKWVQRISIHLLENGPLNFEPVVLEELTCTDVAGLRGPPLKLRECEQKWMDRYDNLVNSWRAVGRFSFKKGLKTWTCICGVTGVGNESQLNTHMRSNKHKRRMDGTWLEKTVGKAVCKACDCLISTLKHHVVQHRNTQKHKRNLLKFSAGVRSTANDVGEL